MCQSPQAAAAAALINNTVAEQRMPPSSLVLEEVLPSGFSQLSGYSGLFWIAQTKVENGINKSKLPEVEG